MDYKITQLTLEKLEKNFDSLMQTLENLKPTGDTNISRVKDIFIEMEKSSKTFIAEKPDEEIIGIIKLLIEPKLNRGGVLAGKVEDVSIREGYEGLGIGSRLMEKVMQEADELGMYKVTLSCREEIVGFYEKFGFVNYSINMKKYLK